MTLLEFVYAGNLLLINHFGGNGFLIFKIHLLYPSFITYFLKFILKKLKLLLSFFYLLV